MKGGDGGRRAEEREREERVIHRVDTPQEVLMGTRGKNEVQEVNRQLLLPLEEVNDAVTSLIH